MSASRRIDLAAIGLRVEALQLHLATLQQCVERGVDHRLRRHGRPAHALQHLAHGQVLAQALREHLGTHALRDQQVAVDAAVGVAQRRKLGVGGEHALQPLVADAHVHVFRRGQQHTLAHDAVERLAPHRRAVEQLDVDVRHLLAIAFDVALVRGIPLHLGDAATVDLGHLGVRCVGEAGVALHAEEDEGRKDQQHQDALEQAGVRADEIEHGGSWARRYQDRVVVAMLCKQRRRTASVRLRSTWPANRSRLAARRNATRAAILSQRAACETRHPGMVGAEGLEPPTYAL